MYHYCWLVVVGWMVMVMGGLRGLVVVMVFGLGAFGMIIIVIVCFWSFRRMWDLECLEGWHGAKVVRGNLCLLSSARLLLYLRYNSIIRYYGETLSCCRLCLFGASVGFSSSQTRLPVLYHKTDRSEV